MGEMHMADMVECDLKRQLHPIHWKYIEYETLSEM